MRNKNKRWTNEQTGIVLDLLRKYPNQVPKGTYDRVVKMVGKSRPAVQNKMYAIRKRYSMAIPEPPEAPPTVIPVPATPQKLTTQDLIQFILRIQEERAELLELLKTFADEINSFVAQMEA